jgi:hypothetical protein
MGKKEPSYTVHDNVKWNNHCGNQYRGSLKTIKIDLLYDFV